MQSGKKWPKYIHCVDIAYKFTYITPTSNIVNFFLIHSEKKKRYLGRQYKSYPIC